MIKIAKYLSKNLILFLNASNRDEALEKLVDCIYQDGKLEDRDSFFQAIIEREKIVSTGIGMGVAIPHAKLPGYDEFFIAIGILKKGVDWQAIDHSPVRIIFMIGGPDDKQTEYLQILSGLTLAIKNEDLRKKLLTLNSPEDIVKLFELA
ncbi:MAG: PTS sugar transporter subunit IIA [Parachlamydiaceae bacterium]